MDVGLSILNPNAAGLSEGCRLKVREFLAAGVPVISKERDSVIPETFPYYIKTNKINVAKLKRICYLFRNTDKNTIRNESKKWISKKQYVVGLINVLKKINEN
jgi:hypothetical protein